jgi:hypothetical protein
MQLRNLPAVGREINSGMKSEEYKRPLSKNNSKHNSVCNSSSISDNQNACHLGSITDYQLACLFIRMVNIYAVSFINIRMEIYD